MNLTALAIASCIALISSCTSGEHRPVPYSQAGPSLIPVGEHHLIFLPTAEAPTSLFVLDRGEAALPDVGLQDPIEHSEVEHDGQDLVLVGGGKAMVRFSVRTEAESERGETVVPVVGISRLDDPSGFDGQVLRSGTEPDAFRLARKARRTLG